MALCCKHNMLWAPKGGSAATPYGKCLSSCKVFMMTYHMQTKQLLSHFSSLCDMLEYSA